MADKAEKTKSEGTTLKVHHLRPAPGARTAKTRVGRGEGSKGKTAGRGTKGTKARYQVPERFEGGQMPLHMRLPKRAVRDGRPVKVLGTGEIDVKVNVTVNKFSGSAKEKIEAAGGSATTV